MQSENFTKIDLQRKSNVFKIVEKSDPLYQYLISENCNIRAVCRSCLAVDRTEMFPLLSSINSCTLADMYTALTSIQVNNNDGLPKQICSTCQKLIVKFYEFRKECEKTNYMLTTFLNGESRSTRPLKHAKVDTDVERTTKDQLELVDAVKPAVFAVSGFNPFKNQNKLVSSEKHSIQSETAPAKPNLDVKIESIVEINVKEELDYDEDFDPIHCAEFKSSENQEVFNIDETNSSSNPSTSKKSVITEENRYDGVFVKEEPDLDETGHPRKPTGSDTDSQSESGAPGPSTKFKLRRIVHKKCVTTNSSQDYRTSGTQSIDYESRRGSPLLIFGDIVIEHDNSHMEDDENPSTDHVQKDVNDSSEKQAKTTAQRMREYRNRKEFSSLRVASTVIMSDLEKIVNSGETETIVEEKEEELVCFICGLPGDPIDNPIKCLSSAILKKCIEAIDVRNKQQPSTSRRSMDVSSIQLPKDVKEKGYHQMCFKQLTNLSGKLKVSEIVDTDAKNDSESESTKASTTEAKKTNAQSCREYRERKKLQHTMVQNITAERTDGCSETDPPQAKRPKTNAERRKKHYEAQKLKNPKIKKIPKTVKQKNKEYYQRKKLKALNILKHHSDASVITEENKYDDVFVKEEPDWDETDDPRKPAGSNFEYENDAPGLSTMIKLRRIVHENCVTTYSRHDHRTNGTQSTDNESRRGSPVLIIGDIVIEHYNNQMVVDHVNAAIDHVQKPTQIIGDRLNKAPKTSPELGQESRLRNALLKQEIKQQNEPDAIVEIAIEDIRSAGASEDKQVPGPSEIRDMKKKAKKPAKTAAQRMREYRKRKKILQITNFLKTNQIL